MSHTDDRTIAANKKQIVDQFKNLFAEDKKEDGEALLSSLLDGFETLQQRNTELELAVERLLRRYVKQSSEKVNSAQLKLFLDELKKSNAQLEIDTPELEHVDSDESTSKEEKKPQKKKRRPKRKPLPDHLPRKIIPHDLDEDQKRCEKCGTMRAPCGEEHSQELEFVPAHFVVNIHVRKKYICKECSEDTPSEAIVRAPFDRVFEKSLVGPGLLAYVLVSKYVDHLPLHRLRNIFLRSDVEIPSSTLSDWVQRAAFTFEPIAKAIYSKVLQSHLVQTDDTGLRVLQKGKGKGQNIRKGHIWVYVGDQKHVAFVYTKTREGIGPQTFLEDFDGYVQADAYSGYDALFDPIRKNRPTEVGCMAHARRYYHELLHRDARAAIPIAHIRKLYDIEREASEDNLTPEERLALRKDRAPPILKAFAEWVASTMENEEPKSALYKAAQYSFNQWKALNRFLEDGRLHLDNTFAERMLRTVAVGRKNYLFAGSDVGAETTATMYTVFGSCNVNGVDPWRYTQDVIKKISAGWPASRLEEILPENWAQNHLPQETDT